jgi:serine/threonine protein kinase
MGSTARFEEQPGPGGGSSAGTHLYVPTEPSTPPNERTVISKASPDQPGGTVVPAPPHEQSKLLAGERLGPYELIEFAGGGGMGAVFRARDTMLNREVAIKVLARDQAADEETLKRFKNEAQSAARLDHENIARVYFVGEDRGLNFIVFEFIEGQNVRQLVDRTGPLRLEDAVSYVLQIADALAHASARDVVHRDIKPSNILITAQGKAKLVDMGLARLHGIQPGTEDLTASGVTLGTFDYISPEQARDPRSADVRSDIYSLGCTFYYTLTGRPPFPEGTVLQKLLQHNSDDPIDPREYNPGLPEAVTTVLRKMLAKDPQRRYQQPTELIADLLHLGDQLGLGRTEIRLTSKWETTVDEGSPWARFLPWLLPAALLLSVVLGLEWYDRSNEQRRRAIEANANDPTPAGRNGKGPNGARGTGSATGTRGTQASVAGQTPAGQNVVPIRGGPRAGPTQVTPEDDSAGPSVASSVVKPATTDDDGKPGIPAPRDGVLVVCDEEGAGRYSTLKGACNAAKNGDVVELCFDGERLERPFSLNNLKVTVRAGEGFRPMLSFRPAETAAPSLPQSMITLAGGRLTLVGVEAEFVVPSPQEMPADRWSLFDLQDHEALSIERCVLTVRNAGADGRAYHPDAAVFATSAPPGVPAAMMNMPMPGPDTGAREPTEIRLVNTVVRGEASLFRGSELRPVSITASNVLAALSETMFVVRGGAMAPRDADLRLELRHVTAVGGGEFLRIAGGFEAPFLPPVHIHGYDSILATLGGGALAAMDGVEAGNALTWRGERIFYEGFRADSFWLLTSPAGTKSLSFDDWQARWGSGEPPNVWGGLRWERSPAATEFSRARPDDFVLDDAEPRQKALGGATDATDVGVDGSQLPTPRAVPKRIDPTRRTADARP